jgi:hypothetical protein
VGFDAAGTAEVSEGEVIEVLTLIAVVVSAWYIIAE